MRLFFSASADATIYEEFPIRNTGADEILSVGKDASAVNSIRALLQFDLTSISSSLSIGAIPISASFDLKLSVARAMDLMPNQQLNFLFLSASFLEGSGFFWQNTNVPFTSSRNPIGGFFEDNGATWNNPGSGSAWTTAGGDYYSSPILSASISDPVTDIIFDVTSFVQTWISGSNNNDGFIIKYPDADEQNNNNDGSIDFFSRQTHTIYQPLLIAKWDDQIYITGSLTGSSPINANITPKNIKPKYKLGEAVRIDFASRDKYPIKQFDTLFTAFSGNQRLPITSYFSIIDIQSNNVIIPFDDNSKISCDGNTSFCNFNIQGLYPGRFYKLLIKTVDSGYEQVYDSGQIFSVETV